LLITRHPLFQEGTIKTTPQDLETALNVLRHASRELEAFDEHAEFKTLVAKISRLAKQRNRRNSREDTRQNDAQTRASALESRAQKTTPSAELRLHKSRNCYICKVPYFLLHGQYHLLCPKCAKLNCEKRQQRANLENRVALLTGGRIKIGFELALKLLRDGARVILTSRFPNNAEARFAAQSDFADWQHHLEIHGLDLRHLPSVERFIAGLVERERHLDILVNNAAQTISRPLDFYRHLLESENTPSPRGLVHSPMQLLQSPFALPDIAQYFPPEQFDADGQALDLRLHNSWMQKLHEVPTRDMLEVQLVNFIAPFMLCAGLKPLLECSPFALRFVVNVSAMEGQFSRAAKGVRHPHTNAAKAALNMLTRTSGADYAKSQIYMTAVDTGWITDENPFPKAQRMRQNGFVPPLDAIDGAARIYDPIAAALNGDPPHFGVFLKNYFPYPW
jgi:NAD(P)-dependent dehydrogenase (short-subunit alcohol dehydrogenase family)